RHLAVYVVGRLPDPATAASPPQRHEVREKPPVRALHSLAQPNQRLPHHALDPPHIQQLPRRAARLARVGVNLARIAHDLGDKLCQFANRYVAPTQPQTQYLDDLKRLKERLPQAMGLKLYPHQIDPYRPWRAVDPQIMKLFEEAQK